MALQVWLPLTKDLTQHGLSGVEVTNNGAVISNDGKLGKCYQFDGSNDYITIPITATETLIENFSFAFWVNFISFNTSYQTVVAATGSSASWAQEIFCFQRSGTSSNFLFELSNGSSSTTTSCLIGPLEINTWYHFVCTYDTGKMSVYQNGELVKTFTTTIKPNFNVIQNFQLGRSHTGYYNSNMKLNDFRLYNHCLSQKEIKELAKGLILHYKLDDLAEEYDNIIFDSSGYENNGTLISAPTLSTDSARYSKSISFDGADDGILIQNLQLSDIINSEVTYSFWIKPNGETGKRSVFFGSYSGISWSIEKTTGNLLRLYWNGSPDETTTGATIADNIWQHICITKKGTNDVKVYINGEQKWTSTVAHNALTFPTTYRIGRDTRSGDNTPYKGLISDFRIYATALSAEDVIELYHTTASIDKQGNVYAGELKEV